MISTKLVTTFLQQAESPEKFKTMLINSMLAESPRDRNYGIVLRHSFSNFEHNAYTDFAEELKETIDQITQNIYPGAYAIYGREKSFISAYRKLCKYSAVTQMKDQYALRLVLSDDFLDTKDATYFAFMILKQLMDYFQSEMGLIIHPVTEKTDEKVPIAKDIRPSLYIPKELPIPMIEYEDFFKNYIMRPKRNGYQGLHFVVQTVEGTSYEIQIWLASMARRNGKMGTAAHEVHKPLDELDQMCIERGPEFEKELLASKIIGEVKIHNTAQDIFPREVLDLSLTTAA